MINQPSINHLIMINQPSINQPTCLVRLLVEEAPQIGHWVFFHRQTLYEVLVVHPYAQPTHHHRHHLETVFYELYEALSSVDAMMISSLTHYLTH